MREITQLMKGGTYKWNSFLIIWNSPIVELNVWESSSKEEGDLEKAFKGISLNSLAVGGKSMVTKINYVKGNFVSTNQHPHEQYGCVISNEYCLKVELVDNPVDVLLCRDSYAIPDNIPHSLEVMEDGEIVDVFTLQREDYL